MKRSLIGVMKSSYIIGRRILYVILLLEGIDFLIDLILSLTINNYGSGGDVSAGNIISSFIMVLPVVLTIYLFKQTILMGGNRKDYFSGKLLVYLVTAAGFSIFNILWFLLEKGIFSTIMLRFNLISIFNWNSYGIIGMFFYQLAAYILVMILLDFVTSCVFSRKGLIIDFLIAAFLSLFLSVGRLRAGLVAVIKLFVINPNIIAGFLLSIGLSITVYYISWYFVKKREFY